jgi:hypothetical protein
MTTRTQRKDLIEGEFEAFFDFSVGSSRDLVTSVSCRLFAEHMMFIEAIRLNAQRTRLLAIERAAWHALELARAGRAEDAYSALSEVLSVSKQEKS